MGHLRIRILRLSLAVFLLASTGILIAFSSPVSGISTLIALQGAASGITLDLELSPTVRVSRVLQMAGLEDVKAAGSLSGTIRIRGRIDELDVTGRMRGGNVSIGGYSRTSLDVRFHAGWNKKTGRILVRSFEIRSPSGEISGSGDFHPDSKTAANSLKARLRNFDLLPLTRSMNNALGLASRATGAATLSWRGGLGALRGDAQLSLTPSRDRADRGVLPVAGVAQVSINAGTVSVRLSSARTLGARLDGSVALLPSGTLDTDLSGAAPDMALFAAELSRFFGRAALLPVKVGGSATFAARAVGRMEQPEGVISFRAPSLIVGDAPSVSVNADATLSRSRLDLSATVVAEPGATISVRGAIGVGQADAPLQLALRAGPMPLAAALRLAGRPVVAAGTIRAALDLDGTMRSLRGVGVIEGEGLTMQGEPLGDLRADLQLSGRDIRLTQFRLTRDPAHPGAGYVHADGAYNLGSRRFSLRSTGKDLRIERLSLGRGIAVRGGVDFAVNGSGTIDSPIVDAELAVAHPEVQGKPLGPLSLRANLRGDDLNANLDWRSVGLTATFHAETNAPYRTDFRVTASQFDVGVLELSGPGERALTGTATMVVTGVGELENLKHAEGAALIQNAAVRVGEIGIDVREPMRVEYRRGLLEIAPEAAVAVGASSLRLAGTIPLLEEAPAGSLRVHGRLDLDDATKLAGSFRGIELSGFAGFDATLSGPSRARSLAGAMTLVNGAVRHPSLPTPLTAISLEAELRSNALVLKRGDASIGAGRASLTGVFPLALLSSRLPLGLAPASGRGPARFDLQLTNVAIESLARLPERIKGVISLRSVGSAAQFDVRSLSAETRFDVLRLTLDKAVIEQSDRSLIVAKDGTVSIKQLTLTGPETELRASGSARLTDDLRLDLRFDGTTDAAILGFLTGDMNLSGPVALALTVAGTTRSPRLSGFAELKDGQAAMRDPALLLDSLNVRLGFSGARISVERLEGVLNGGALRVRGALGIRAGMLNDFDLSASFRDVFLEFPKGLKSFFNANLTVASQEDAIRVGGRVRVVESSYRDPIEIGSQLLAFFESGERTEIVGERSKFLERIRFNVAVQTVAPLMVENNLAELEAEADLKLVGGYYEPSVVGRVTLEEGGQIFLNERTYYLRRGVITLNNESRIEPDLNVQAETTVGQWDITMQITGPPERLTTQLSSEPQLAQVDIVSVLLTGRPTAQLSGREFQMAEAQALSLLAGQAGQELARGAQGLLGITTVRLEPSFIAAETDPGARVTLGQDITRDFSVGYSMSLVEAGDQIWLAEYDISRRFTTQAIGQEDNTYRMGFTHQLHIGGPPESRGRRRDRPEIGAVRFEAGPLFTEKFLMNRFDQEPGDDYQFPKVQKGLDRIKKSYVDKDRLESRIRLQRERNERNVDLVIRIDDGPEVELVFIGPSIPNEVRNQVRQIWEQGVFDTARLHESANAIRRHFIEQGYPQCAVAHEVETQPERKTVRFRITPGPRYDEVRVEFPGASGIEQAELEEVLKNAGLSLAPYLEPEEATRLLEGRYRGRGYLDVDVSPAELRFDSARRTAIIAIPIREGARFKVGKLDFSGNRVFDYDELWMLIPISTGSYYSPEGTRESEEIIERFYRSRGYNEVTVGYSVDSVSDRAEANITFRIEENRQSVIWEIAIEGNRLTDDRLVRRLLPFGDGDVLDYAKIGDARRSLYDTGIYSLVDFEAEDLQTAQGAATKPVRVRVRLRELSTYQIDYGGYYDTDRGPGGIADIVRRSPFGDGAALGLRLRYDSDLQLSRLFYSQPHIRNLRLKTDVSALWQRESREGFSARRVGISLLQQKELPKEFKFDYGYRYDHVRWTGIPEDPTLFVSDVPVARLTGALWRDTRDSILDATRGEFMSNALEYGPTWLGSEIGFVRYFGQYFRYVGLDRFLLKPIRKKNKLERARLLYAGALRLGLTKAFEGQEIISPERFYAGGGTTMRGFGQDLLGPVEVIDGQTRPLGGEAMFLLNNEIRFPIISIFGGAAFADIGNVYRTVSDFDLRDLRYSAGLGLRVRIRFLLLRFDYGFKLDRRPGETPSAFFFSIGQAF